MKVQKVLSSLQILVRRRLAGVPRASTGKDGAEVVLEALEPAMSAAGLPREHAALAASFSAKWSNLPPEKEQARARTRRTRVRRFTCTHCKGARASTSRS